MNDIDLQIDRLAFGGRGVGRHEGMAVFVPHTAPGDRVRARIVKQRKRFAEATLLQILSPGPGRRTPPCSVADRCGGCQWQHLAYGDQCVAKETIFRDLLVRQAGVAPERIGPLVAAPAEWNYRSRVQLKVRWDGALHLGFYARESHEIVSFVTCPVMSQPLNRLLEPLRTILPAWPAVKRLERIDLNQDDRGQVRLMLYVAQGGSQQEAAALGELWPGDLPVNLLVCDLSGRNPRQILGEPLLTILPQGEEGPALQYGPGGFAQINLAQNRRLAADLLEQVAVGPGDRVLDLYCGMGNFSLPLARTGAAVTGVESAKSAVTQGRRNAVEAGLAQVKFLAAEVEGWLNRKGRNREFDLVVLDPPRAGAANAIPALLKMAPKRLAYISCDAVTLARDLRALQAGGYAVNRSTAYDLFPQTYHMESLTLLKRKIPA